MLATEQEESEERERERKEALYEEQVHKCRENTREYLFGKDGRLFTECEKLSCCITAPQHTF